MIKRMLITFAVLAAGYAAFVALVPVTYDTGQHLQGSNRIKAEAYLYGEGDAPSDVIVGSSLAFRMVADSLKPGTFNLAVGGLSYQEGLDLIARSGRWPKRVFIETNILFRKYDAGFMKAVANPVMMTARTVAPMLREKNQPSGLLFGWLKARAKAELGTTADTSAALNGNTEARGYFMLEKELARGVHVPSLDTINLFLERLSASVKELESHGTEVVFFEMPVDERLRELPLAEASRAVIHQRFPAHRYFEPAAGARYITTDGLHLRKESAARWSGDFRRALQE